MLVCWFDVVAQSEIGNRMQDNNFSISVYIKNVCTWLYLERKYLNILKLHLVVQSVQKLIS